MGLLRRKSNRDVQREAREAKAKADAPRLAGDKRYGIDTARYTGQRKKKGISGIRGSNRFEDYTDEGVRKGLIKNAQIKKTATENRKNKESRENEAPIATRKTRKSASGRVGRLSLLSMLGQEDNRYGGL